MRASGVFTGTTNSPSRLPRQSLYHSTIRAGRNLPDKEFRYLRTVIVTAAVHRGFSSGLRPCGLSPCFNLPAPGRCHPLRSEEHTSELQSHLNLVSRLLLEKKNTKHTRHHMSQTRSHEYKLQLL